MSKSIQYLAIALIVQCLILATVLISKNQNHQNDGGLLLEFEPATIDSLTIGDNNGDEIEVKKQGDAWVLPSYGNLPVKPEKVSEILEGLANLHITWPVASTEEAATRFEVALDNAQKSLKIKSADEIISKLYLGTSPGFRKVHARASEDKNIYAVEFPQYSVSTKGEDWFDKGLLSFQSAINTLKVGEHTFSKIDAGWSVSGVEPQETDLSKVETWLKNIATLQVSKLITGNDKDKLLVKDPDLEIQAESDGKMASYKLWKQGEQYYIKRSDNDQLFEIASYQAKKYFDLDVSSFAIENTSENQDTDAAQSMPFSPDASFNN